MIRLIAAIDRKRGIAKHGFQPWCIPADELYFKKMTLEYGAVVLMGRKTFETIGHPLPDRRNVVLSQTEITEQGVEVATDIGVINGLGDVWVIGGESVFSQTILNADELYLTRIEADFGCDQFFPDFVSDFELVKEEPLLEQNGFLFTQNVYSKKSFKS